MTTFLYPKLAAGGIKKNYRIYLPYLFACAGMIMMFYITSFLSVSRFVFEMKGGDIMQAMLMLGCWVLAVFSAIFLFYTNSFLIRRRKTEFGLYNVLGMGKRNIARILVWETLIVYVLAEAIGLGCGILFSKLAELLLTKMLGNEASYSFTVEPKAITDSLVFYAVIFLLILINALRQIHLSNPVELLHSENAGERPPKANWFLAVVGAILLGISYYMAVTIESPLAAIFTFFFAVLMVIAATYLLFIAGSVVMCKMLQRNKKYYYKTNHFVSVSQMTYRMKRNGAGLASICILATMLLVTLSSTTCLFVGMNDMLRQRYPRNIIIDSYTAEEEFTSVSHGAAEKALEKFGETPENVLHYSFLDISGGVMGNTVYLSPEKRDMFDNSLSPDIRQLYIVTVDDYNRLMGKNETLSDGEIVLYVNGGRFDYDTLTLDEYGTFTIKSRAEDFEGTGSDAMMSAITSMYLFVKDDAVVKELYDLQLGIYGNASSYMHDYYGFDLSCNEEKQLEIFEDIHSSIARFKKELTDAGGETSWRGYRVESIANDRAGFFALYGGLFFLGGIFGMVFICAAALIMYYKQISEGFEDKAKFGILQKVGMTKAEIRRSINSQVLTVFFMPLGAAGLHMVFAFPIVSRLLLLFGLSNTALFAAVTLCCFGAFSLVYTAVYLITSRSYYKIVSTDRD